MDALIFLFVIVVIPAAVILLLIYLAGHIYKWALGRGESVAALETNLRRKARYEANLKKAAQNIVNRFDRTGRI